MLHRIARTCVSRRVRTVSLRDLWSCSSTTTASERKTNSIPTTSSTAGVGSWCWRASEPSSFASSPWTLARRSFAGRRKVTRNTKKLRKRRKKRSKDTWNGYSLYDALRIVQSFATASFDESIELTCLLELDPRKPNNQVTGSLVLPGGTGKKVRVAVFAEGAKADKAREMGAAVVGSDDLIARIQEGVIDFDRVLCTPDLVPRVARIARILGPRGLMPNAKMGSITLDIEGALEKALGGEVQLKSGQNGHIDCAVGKASFDHGVLAENVLTMFNALVEKRPEAARKDYIVAFKLGSTQGPGTVMVTARYLEKLSQLVKAGKIDVRTGLPVGSSPAQEAADSIQQLQDTLEDPPVTEQPTESVVGGGNEEKVVENQAA